MASVAPPSGKSLYNMVGGKLWFGAPDAEAPVVTLVVLYLVVILDIFILKNIPLQKKEASLLKSEVYDNTA